MERVLVIVAVVLLAAIGIFLLTRRRFLIGGGLGLLAVAGAVFVLPQTYPPGSIVCKSGQPCNISVSVTDCIPRPDYGYDPIIVLVGHGAVNIFWKAPPGYTFTDPGGIYFKDNNGDIDPRPGSTNAGAVWHVVDNPAHPVEIHYRIEVKRNTDGKVCTGPDPIILNY